MGCVCLHCGKTYKPKVKDRVTFCSRECSFAYRRTHGNIKGGKPRLRSSDVIGKVKGVLIRVGDCSEIHLEACVWCGELFVCRHGKTYCSPKCRYKRNKKQKRDKRASSLYRIPAKCFHCGEGFISKRMNNIYCSHRCMRKSAKARRNSRVRNSDNYKEVSVDVLIKRDGKKCGICGGNVWKREVPHPKSPTIDHIQPLSLGGEHNYKNAQLAHFICNSIKNNDFTNDQLRIF